VAALAQSESPRFELGPTFSVISLDHAFEKTHSGVGERFTWNLSRHFAFDSVLTITPIEPQTAANVEGGRLTQGQFGIKAAWKRKRVGVFGKARPGFVSFSQAITNEPNLFDQGLRTFFSFDIGGGAEVYPSARTVLRFDFGDTLIRYPVIPTPFGTLGSSTTNNFQFSTSVQFRFSARRKRQ
jgi:hypothetical protein